MGAGSPFHVRLWAEVEPEWQAITGHPFLLELAQGTLQPGCFLYFLEQDALYLEDFARLLAAAAAKAPSRQEIQLFLNHALGVFEVETALHQTLTQAFGQDPARLSLADRGPATQAYLDFLFGWARDGDYSDLVMALLPCFWVYREVGTWLAQGPPCPHPLYRQWIETYSGPSYGEAVAEQIALADRLADLAPGRQDAFSAIFRTGVQHERAFWDQAYSNWQEGGPGTDV